MRELTMLELEAQLAEQLPARELMGARPSQCGCQGGPTYNQGSYDGNGNGDFDSNFGLIAVQVDGNGNGDLDGLNVL
jgi:hypothetical protein